MTVKGSFAIMRFAQLFLLKKSFVPMFFAGWTPYHANKITYLKSFIDQILWNIRYTLEIVSNKWSSTNGYNMNSVYSYNLHDCH